MPLGGKHLADYGATRSRTIFIHPRQLLMACLILRAISRPPIGAWLEFLSGESLVAGGNFGLGRQTASLHHTLQKFAPPNVLEIAIDDSNHCPGHTESWSGTPKPGGRWDATGRETTTAQPHFQCLRLWRAP